MRNGTVTAAGLITAAAAGVLLTGSPASARDEVAPAGAGAAQIYAARITTGGVPWDHHHGYSRHRSRLSGFDLGTTGHASDDADVVSSGLGVGGISGSGSISSGSGSGGGGGGGGR